MTAPERIDEGEDHATAEREFFERLGYVRGQTAAAEQVLARLRARQQELTRQVDVVETECRSLERELAEKLGVCLKLDAGAQRVDDQLLRFKAITSSFTYRGVAGMLNLVNRARWVLTFGWLRRGS